MARKRQKNASDRGTLSDFSLKVYKGELVLLTGPSGCGKSTVLRLINGLIPHFFPGKLTGEVLINGENISSKDLYETARIVGTVFQNPRSQFYNVDTTGELAFGCENQGLPAEEIYDRIDHTVARFQIEKLMDRSIFRLSGGEKQKIACAAIDAAETDIILLDEPSANLDYNATIQLRELIRIWKENGKTIIAAEHRIAYLWDMIDRAVIMDNGQIVSEIRGDEKDSLKPENLAKMGLRSTKVESPAEVELPVVLEGDKTFTIQDMYFSYNGSKTECVNIDTLTLSEGKITAITGANGIGKTTFLNCFCGLERHCKGSLEFRGKLYTRKKRKTLCFMVMQDSGHQLFTESVMEEVIISFPKNTEQTELMAKEILERVDLSQFADRHPMSLSGGQKQRLAIACAIASGREILLLDEPTSGLDYRHMMETAKLLRDLCDSGITILVVTHDSELIHVCCDRKIVLSQL